MMVRFAPALVLVLALALGGADGARAQLVGVDFGPGAAPGNWNAVAGPGRFANLRDDSGAATGIGLQVQSAGKPFAVSPHQDSVPAYAGDLTALDGNLYEFAGTFQARFTGLNPGQSYGVYVFGLRSGADLRQQVELVGGDRVSFVQTAADGMLSVIDETGSQARTLGSYAKPVVAAADGTIAVKVIGGGEQGRPFVLAGLALDLGGDAAAAPQTAGAASAPAATATAVSAAPATTASAAPAPRSTPQGPDVVGVYLGMALEEAFAVVHSGFPEIPLKPYEADVGSIYRSRLRGLKYPGGFSGSYFTPGTNEKITVAGFSPPADGRVAAVGRTSYLGDMLYADLRASLVEKYGTPHFEAAPGEIRNAASYVLSWSLTRDGQPQTDAASVIACSSYGNKRAEELTGYVVNLWDTAEQMNGQYDSCGFTMVVYAMPQDLPSLVRFYNIVLYDLNEIRTATRATLDMAERQAQQLEAEREASAAGKKPRL